MRLNVAWMKIYCVSLRTFSTHCVSFHAITVMNPEALRFVFAELFVQNSENDQTTRLCSLFSAQPLESVCKMCGWIQFESTWVWKKPSPILNFQESFSETNSDSTDASDKINIQDFQRNETPEVQKRKCHFVAVVYQEIYGLDREWCPSYSHPNNASLCELHFSFPRRSHDGIFLCWRSPPLVSITFERALDHWITVAMKNENWDTFSWYFAFGFEGGTTNENGLKKPHKSTLETHGYLWDVSKANWLT